MEPRSRPPECGAGDPSRSRPLATSDRSSARGGSRGVIVARHRLDMVVEPRSSADLDNMRLVLRLKLQAHPSLASQLLATGSARLVEDCSRRAKGSGLFWGAALRNGQWVGENWLGRLWMELRDSLRHHGSGHAAARIGLTAVPNPSRCRRTFDHVGKAD